MDQQERFPHWRVLVVDVIRALDHDQRVLLHAEHDGVEVAPSVSPASGDFIPHGAVACQPVGSRPLGASERVIGG